MKYKLGDFVRFVDEKLEGYVTQIMDEQMIGVTVEDDFEIPVLASKVTYVHGHNEVVHTDDDILVPITTIAPADFKTKGVHVAVVPDAKANGLVHLYIVNETSYQLLASVVTEQQKAFKGEFAGAVDAHGAAKVYSAKLSDLQLWPKLHFQALFHTKQNQPLPEPLNVAEQFKAKDFSGAKKMVPVIKQQGWMIQIDEPELIIDAQKLKEAFFKPSETKPEITKPDAEIDLHIEKLRDDYQFLSSSEILAIQLDTFKKKLDAAVVHNMTEITFIHGTGNGILKHELHKLLSKNQKVQTFLDARKEKFGYGATLVMLK
ncbi:DNA mismatch repair protein MutS [Mucilaginibacter pallidiroseus]|uniref:DNA mismatch repair protein MutS n=1 Tax=Mucilaginibacter pallidiroseus TaxID=2599295 RepID=A0A563UC57_9SPHI|nr:Smr/MutS family protein [Mucilaginibacter pallidiroseus]TWR28962.1 DNA mismatch repair protein MutS [Mucilaginibacter pallidiroseus]